MSKKEKWENDHHHDELLESIKKAEVKFVNGQDKEESVVKSFVPRILSASGLGWLARFGAKKILPFVLRIAIRAVIKQLNEALGNDWLEKSMEKQKRKR